MKKLVMIALVAVSFVSRAQQHVAQNGLYKSADDFAAGRISHEFDADSKEKIVKYPAFFKGILIKSPGNSMKVDPSEYWGFRDNFKDYRFYKGDKYAVGKEEGFFIYEKTNTSTVQNEMYFSREASGPLYPLTIKDLREAFDDDNAVMTQIAAFQTKNNFNEVQQLSSLDVIHIMRTAAE